LISKRPISRSSGTSWVRMSRRTDGWQEMSLVLVVFIAQCVGAWVWAGHRDGADIELYPSASMAQEQRIHRFIAFSQYEARFTYQLMDFTTFFPTHTLQKASE
jgi:hypothetical protein